MNTTVTLVNDTTSVSLTCEVDGATSYNWERQSGSIPSGATGVNTNTLTIINLTPEDAGNYRCVATNASGSSESDYGNLTINGEFLLIEYMYMCTCPKALKTDCLSLSNDSFKSHDRKY